MKDLKMYGGLEKIFELIVTEKGIIQDYCITVLSGEHEVDLTHIISFYRTYDIQ